MKLLRLTSVLLLFWLICSADLSGIGLSPAPIRFFEINTSGSIPLATLRYGVRYYFFWRPSDEVHGTRRFMDMSGCFPYTKRYPRYGCDVGVHMIAPIYTDQNWTIEYSLRWSSFQRWAYEPRNYSRDWRPLKENLAISVGLAHDLRTQKINRAGIALWLHVPDFKVGIPLVRRLLRMQIFVQANIPLNEKLPEYISPLQGGIEFSVPIYLWTIKRSIFLKKS